MGKVANCLILTLTYLELILTAGYRQYLKSHEYLALTVLFNYISSSKKFCALS